MNFDDLLILRMNQREENCHILNIVDYCWCTTTHTAQAELPRFGMGVDLCYAPFGILTMVTVQVTIVMTCTVGEQLGCFEI